jgi:toxin-antitoxin system PIN domain toxin
VSRVALLDVNLLVALFDPDHVHHELAHDWFADHHDGWATCPVTENGFVRVVSHPDYGAASARAPELISRLRQFTQSEHHTFWTASVSLRDEKIFKASHIRGHRQLTDVYLLGLAVAMKGCLATFDRTIPRSAVEGATRDSLQIVSAADDSTNA